MIVRSPRPVSQYTVLSNAVIRDYRLSWKARGILCYLLSLPDNWQTSAEQLVRAGQDGRHAVLAGLTELEDAGYLVRIRKQKPNGQWHTTTVVFDNPQTVDNSEQPKSGNPTSGNLTPKEVTTKKDVVEKTADETLIESPQVCGQCLGYGTKITETGDLAVCSCR